jgi:hypothetical protein
MGKVFKMSNVQSMGMSTIWECERCGKDNYEEDLRDRTPEGCIAVTQGTEVTHENCNADIVDKQIVSWRID